MKRRSKSRSSDLIALQENFWLAVVFGGDPDARAKACWYGLHIDSPRNCEGRIIASHFIKRRRIENYLQGPPGEVADFGEPGFPEYTFYPEYVQLAAWDPRLAVPGCQAHDDRWDGHRMPPLRIGAHQVPLEVALGALDWGIEGQIEDRCPLFESGVVSGCHTTVPTLELARSERALFDG